MKLGETVTIRNPVPKGRPLAGTHEVVCELTGPTVKDGTLVWRIENVRIERGGAQE